ncbi:response regulator [Methylobacterium sp. R2-1]|uniref:response regulator n=1 Tax=Methylobacterium sp. R2-1 TaxID=2587064 RepID=UPI00161DD97A|nr:response regulator [Methylobacterium sp. R2-1]MBB2960940.1 CheY-like chemotaxis protein [Methylobacterium sp. R2-1]
MRRADHAFHLSSYEPVRTTIHGVAHGLADAYAGLADVELPDELASLVLLLHQRDAVSQKQQPIRSASSLPTKLVVVVEDDPTVRELAVAMLEETALDVLACTCAEEAIAIMRQHADDVAMLFTDVQLAGGLNGIELASLADNSWPNVHLVVTSGGMGHRVAELPERAVFLDKPWRALDVLVQVERAVRQ